MMNHRYCSKFVLSCALLLSLTSQAQLEVPPQLEWKTLKTPHFEVIYNAKQQDVGFLYAEKLEKAYFALKNYFHSLPEKTVVVINDKTDVTNGYATRLPYPHIMAYPVLPGPEDSLADTGDWAFELLAHEYTHILTFEPANGVMKPLRSIFGNIIAPNILLPNWWKEGIAVEMETRLGRHGRLRSYFQEATLRAMVDTDTLFQYDIAEANEALPTWPKGMRPYLFGSLMWSQIIAEHGNKVVADLNERHGGRVPYFIEAPAYDNLQENYTSQYNKALQETLLRAQTQLKTLREAPITSIFLPKNNFTSVTAPAISPDGKHLALIAEDDANLRSVKVITKENDKQSFLDAPSAETVEKFNEAFVPTTPQDGPPMGSIQRVSWFPQSNKIIYDKVDFTNRIERFSDLYTYDLTTRKTEKFTQGLRAREPAVSPDGQQVVFVKLEASRTHIGLLSLNDPEKRHEIVFSPQIQERISYPIFWDRKTILFSMRKLDGTEQLYRLNLNTKEVQTVLPEFKNVRFAKKTTEGLLFTSGQNGALNLYLASTDLNRAKPITNTTTAFFSADMDPLRKEVFTTHMTHEGLKVGAISPEEWRKTPKKIPKIEPMMGDRYTGPVSISEEEIQSSAQQALRESTTEDYSPYGYLWPQYWMPFISGSSSETGVILQARTSGFDPLKKHSYTLYGSWDTALNKGSLEGSYLNQTTRLPIAALAYKRSSYLGTLSNEITDSGGALATLPDMFWINKYSSLQVGWQYQERTTLARGIKRTGPFGMFSYTSYVQSGAQISPESGKGFYLGAYNYIPQDGYLSHSQFVGGGEIYLSSFLPKHHAVMLRLNAMYTPEVIGATYGAATEPLVYYPDSPLPQYILRGYKRGQIYGTNLATVNFEYRFPIKNIYSGSGTDAYFLKRLSGAFVADGAAADGRFLNDENSRQIIIEKVDMKRSFWSAGGELKLETTLGYVIPLNVVLGYYVAFNGARGVEGVFGTTLQVPSF